MKQALTPGQIADLAEIRKLCDEMGADLVVIGATSLLLSLGGLGRFTHDVDLTVALDLDEFAALADRLDAAGWKRAPKIEHRWLAPNETIVDLLPAGAALRRNGSILWPVSQFEMSLAGFEHVFAKSVETSLSPDTQIRVAPTLVTTLLKIIAYTEDPYRRAKDLQDIKIVLQRYADESDRLFADEVFDAGLSDLSFANAFLLGLDLRALTGSGELVYIEKFLKRFLPDGAEGDFDEDDSAASRFQGQIQALKKGFQGH